MPERTIARFREWFRRVYVNDLAAIIKQRRAVPAFILACTGIEALAGFRFPDQPTRQRFCDFIRSYFPREYRPHAPEFWRQRNLVIHDFMGVYSLGHPERHLTTFEGVVVFNIENLHAALTSAADMYFAEIESPGVSQRSFLVHDERVRDRLYGLELPPDRP